MAYDLRTSELEHKFLKGRISVIEKHFADISTTLSANIKKESNAINCGKTFAKSISQYAAKEDLNKSLRISLGELSDILTNIQEHKETKIQRIEVRTVLELLHYASVCKKIKNDLKKCFEIREKEIHKRNNVEKVKAKKSPSWQKIALAEKEASEAQEEASHATLELRRKMESFEKQKLSDIKGILLELINTELIFHAKAIELYTTAYNKVQNINVEEDLEEFKDHFKACSGNLNSTSSLDLNPCIAGADMDNGARMMEELSINGHSSAEHLNFESGRSGNFNFECGDH